MTSVGAERGESAGRALGPFELIRVLGQGGGGAVWLARHSAQGIAVAVKVMTAEGAKEPTFRARFVDEVRAVARLDHPGIVTIVDHGSIPADRTGDSSAVLPEGSPYLVMELAEGGTLPSLEPLQDFLALRRVLLTLLDALAHAHARGVIHRDLKPGNVLVTGPSRKSPGLKLTDFGIAYAVESGATRSGRSAPRLRAGTPAYMAPEQIRGDLANQGPWTDLYALGCLAYRLTSGHTPFSFSGNDVDQLLDAHLHALVPPVAGRYPLPAGFDDWLSGLLAKAPWARFQCAADAARVLRGLPEDPCSEGGDSSATVPHGDDRTRDGTSTLDALSTGRTIGTLPPDAPTLLDTGQCPAPVHDGDGQEPSVGARALCGPAPFPTTWRLPDPPPRPLQLVGAGLGLFGLRQLQLSGREHERTTMWGALEGVYEERETRLVALHGPAGVGKSRLAEWLCQRAQELGCAEVARATHGSFPGPADGLPHMLAQTLRCVGLGRSAIRRQIRHVLAIIHREEGRTIDEAERDYLSLALTELIEPATAEPDDPEGRGDDRVHFSQQGERYAVVRRLLRQKCRLRPMVLWLDDVAWGREALGFARHLLEDDEQLPLLVVLTYRDETLEQRPVEGGLVQRLLEDDRCQEIALAPLGPTEQLELIQGMLGLEPDLAAQVQQRTEGNPLFAVQLVGDWVERGVLEVGPAGFRLKEGERAELPDDIHDMWRWRIDHLAEGAEGEATRGALEVAAALGDDISAREWRGACELEGIEIPEGMVELMVQRRLAERSDVGWTFVHTMLRESLERSARQAGRWRGRHATCARALVDSYGPDSPETAERLALHYLGSEALEQAVAPLLTAADLLQRRGDFDRASMLCERREAVLAELALPESDERFLEGWLLMARCCFKQSDLDGAESHLARTEEHLGEGGGPPSPHRAAALRTRAQVTRYRGDIRRALAYAEEASRQFRQLGDELMASDCDVIVARLHLESTGDHNRGLELTLAADTKFRQAEDKGRLAECAYITGHLHLALDHRSRALRAADEARRLYKQVGNRFGMAASANFRGEVARQQGDYAKAEEHYLAATRILETMGAASTIVPRLNLALTKLQRGSYETARPLLERLEGEGGEGKHAVQCFANYSLLVCESHDRRWQEWDRQLEAARGFRPETGRVDQDLADLAERAGDLVAQAGDPGRARRAYRLAREHWVALDRSDAVNRVEDKLAALEH